MVASYTHNDPRVGNMEVKAGAVAIFGEITPSGPFKEVATVVDKLTNSQNSMKGRMFSYLSSSFSYF